MATATISASGKAVIVTDLVDGAQSRKVYPVTGVTSQYREKHNAQTVQLLFDGDVIISNSSNVANGAWGNSIFGSTVPSVSATTAETVLGAAGGSGGGAATAKEGDAKSSFVSTDHAGWVKLDGRLKTTLTATQ